MSLTRLITGETQAVNTLACPRCGEALLAPSRPDAGELRCPSCGPVAELRLGAVDFLSSGRVLAGALGARMDLDHDAAVAAEVWERRGTMAHAELCEYAVGRLRDESPLDPADRSLRARAQRRYERWYHCIACEVGDRAGDGTVARADAARAARSQQPLQRDLAVEAGSGVGRHLPGLARHFRTVICVDCSLTYLVLAQELVRASGVDNVVFVRANVEALPLASASADLVHQNGVIEHVADPQAMVGESLRVTAPQGSYVCVSPNRYPLTPEAHFKLPLFGLFPAWLRARLLPLIRGVDSEVGTDLRSVGQLRRYFAAAGVSRPHIFFISPNMRSTVRDTRFRRLVLTVLARRRGRALADWILNRLLVGIAPYQVVVAPGRPASDTHSA